MSESWSAAGEAIVRASDSARTRAPADPGRSELRRLRALIAVGRALAPEVPGDAVVRRALDVLHHSGEVTRPRVWLPSAAGDGVRLLAGGGDGGRIRDPGRTTAERLGTAVIESGRPMEWADVLAHAAGGGAGRQPSPVQPRAIGVPMALPDGTAGAVTARLVAKGEGAPLAAIAFLEVVASMVALAIRAGVRDRTAAPGDVAAAPAGAGGTAGGTDSVGSGAGTRGRAPFHQALAAFEREALLEALRLSRGNRAKAARMLETTERILNYKVRKHGIDWKQFKPVR